MDNNSLENPPGWFYNPEGVQQYSIFLFLQQQQQSSQKWRLHDSLTLQIYLGSQSLDPFWSFASSSKPIVRNIGNISLHFIKKKPERIQSSFAILYKYMFFKKYEMYLPLSYELIRCFQTTITHGGLQILPQTFVQIL